ncbi:hypothetical protein Dimus_003104, partial [Dionaea muscipula]
HLNRSASDGVSPVAWASLQPRGRGAVFGDFGVVVVVLGVSLAVPWRPTVVEWRSGP